MAYPIYGEDEHQEVMSFEDRRASQNETLYQHMIKGGRVTPLSALRDFGIFRLSGRIYDIRKAHPECDIVRDWVHGSGGKRFGEYWMRGRYDGPH